VRVALNKKRNSFDMLESPTSRNAKICTVIVTYHPDITVLGRLVESIRSQVHMLVFVDNGSTSAVVGVLENLASTTGATLVRFEENKGIAAAHNAGIRIADEGGCDYVLLLDHDSQPASDMVRHLVDAHRHLSQEHKVAAVGPRYVDPASGHWSKFVRFGKVRFESISCPDRCTTVETDILISSGSLISLTAIREIGAMDESLFIDHVDTEWCLRAANGGWRTYGACMATMFHRLGDSGIHLRWPRGRRMALHSPLRHYYMYRNSLALMRRPYSPWRWRINDCVRLSYTFAVFIVFAPNRLERLSNILLGIFHGLLGTSGKRSS
jgi:rhamnosyltransferase